MNRYHVLAFACGVVVAAHLRGDESSCCARVGSGVRGKLVSAAGPLGSVAGVLYDALGLAKLSPKLLDVFGVPKDA